jgi:tripartite-type tricarboxylate transporter receptor subunit TctC
MGNPLIIAKTATTILVVIIVIALVAGVYYYYTTTKTPPGFPIKPITIVCGWAPGASSDAIVRALAPGIQEYFNMTVAVTNIEGANGAVGGVEVLKAPPDGHTLFGGAYAMVQWHVVGAANASWADFYPILTARSVSAIGVRPDSPWRNLTELLNYIKANPGKIRFGSTGVGSGNHLFMMSILKESKIPLNAIVHVPYRGGAEAYSKLLAGEVEVIGFTWGDLTPYILAGHVRPLVTSSEEDIYLEGYGYIDSVLKYIPTIKGYLDAFNVYFGIYIPRNVPDQVVVKIVEAVKYATRKEIYINVTRTRSMFPVFIIGNKSDTLMSMVESSRAWLLYELGLISKSPTEWGIPRIEEWKWPPHDRAAKAKPWPGGIERLA